MKRLAPHGVQCCCLTTFDAQSWLPELIWLDHIIIFQVRAILIFDSLYFRTNSQRNPLMRPVFGTQIAPYTLGLT